ncbi:MAG TPA: hypothetical protein VN958_05350, partial [Chitinophagaceae bacterium]|nr:hypothetical protein [Chitinophagaceae bacterium]
MWQKFLLLYILLLLLILNSSAQTLSKEYHTFSFAKKLQTVYFNLPPNLPQRLFPLNHGYSFTTNTNLSITVTDPENDKLRVRFYGRKKNTATTATAGKFTIILLPDTQYYTAEPQGMNGGENNMFKSQTVWIANNRTLKNIVYVGHLGDCGEHGDYYEVEWKRADTAINKLENPNLTGLSEGMPYGICVGNHDQTPLGDPTGTTKFYTKYFGAARFKGKSYYGGHFGIKNDNSYQLFSAGGIGFLVISLEFNPTTNFKANGGPLDWGENLIKAHPHRKVIVLSHYVLNSDATFSYQGNAIYNRFKVYPNFMLMSGGHVTDASAEAKRMDIYNGNTVYTILSNYQARTNGGHGLLRIYEFDPVNNNIAVQTYSPYTNTYETDSDSQFNLKVNLTSTATNTVDSFTLINELNDVPSGSNVDVNWSSLEENADYEWYAEVSDGENKIIGPTWSFTTKLQAGNIINSNQMQQAERGVKKHSSNELFTIYPDPNNTNHLTLSFNKEIREEVSVEIFNITGYLQLKKTFKNISNIIN